MEKTRGKTDETYVCWTVAGISHEGEKPTVGASRCERGLPNWVLPHCPGPDVIWEGCQQEA